LISAEVGEEKSSQYRQGSTRAKFYKRRAYANVSIFESAACGQTISRIARRPFFGTAVPRMHHNQNNGDRRFKKRRTAMNVIREQFHSDTIKAWSIYMDALEKSIQDLEKDIEEAADMSHRCTNEWCEATEHVIDEINDALFMISEPRWSRDEDSRRIKNLKKRVRELYARYKSSRSKSVAA
jgi:hypothetical protein